MSDANHCLLHRPSGAEWLKELPSKEKEQLRAKYHKKRNGWVTLDNKLVRPEVLVSTTLRYKDLTNSDPAPKRLYCKPQPGSFALPAGFDLYCSPQPRFFGLDLVHDPEYHLSREPRNDQYPIWSHCSPQPGSFALLAELDSYCSPQLRFFGIDRFYDRETLHCLEPKYSNLF